MAVGFSLKWVSPGAGSVDPAGGVAGTDRGVDFSSETELSAQAGTAITIIAMTQSLMQHNVDDRSDIRPSIRNRNAQIFRLLSGLKQSKMAVIKVCWIAGTLAEPPPVGC